MHYLFLCLITPNLGFVSDFNFAGLVTVLRQLGNICLVRELFYAYSIVSVT